MGREGASSPIRRFASLLRQTIFELTHQRFLLQIPSDEDQLAEPSLFFFPEPIPIDREPVVDAVEDRSPRVSANPDDAFCPINLAPFTDRL